MNIRSNSSLERLKVSALAVISLFVLQACATSSGGQKVDVCPVPATGLDQYVIGPGDVLQIVVWRNDELSTTIPVRPDGKISTPLVDDMVASGKTPTQLGEDMEEILAEYLRTPEVSVIVTQQGATNQIQVVGEVVTPQSLSYREDLRILDVIVAVGGLGEFAAANRTRIVREVDGAQVECTVKVKKLMSGDITQNIPVFPGDVIVVPETRF